MRRLDPANIPHDPVPTPSAPAVTVSALTSGSFNNSDLLDRFREAWKIDAEWRAALQEGDTDFVHDASDNMVTHCGRPFVPEHLRKEIVHSRHDALIAGHPGRACTLNLVSRDFLWPGMRTYIRRYVTACPTCAQIKNPQHKPYGLLQPLEIPKHPWRAITMDFIVKLPKSHGYDSIWVICDRLTRAAHFIPIKEATSTPDLVYLFVNRFFRHHGMPDSILSDRGATFVSQFMQEFASRVGIELKHSTAYHPRTDGLTKRTNQTLKTYLCAYCLYQQDDWVNYLPLAKFAFNNADNASTRVSPFYANLGYHPTFAPRLSKDRTTVPAAADLASRLDLIHKELRAKLRHAQDDQTRNFNCHVQPAPKFKTSDLVWLSRRNIKTTRPSDKLKYCRLGPYKIIKPIGRSVFKLELPCLMSRLHPVFHVSLLEPVVTNDIHGTPPAPGVVHLAKNDAIPVINDFLNCCKVGRRYNYFVDWVGLPNTKCSWISLSDIPTALNEKLERFHRRHTKLPQPHHVVIDAVAPANFDAPAPPASSEPLPPPPPSPVINIAHPQRTTTPPPQRINLHVPPAQTTTRSGRVSRCPGPRLNPSIPGGEPPPLALAPNGGIL
jgi:hypothetical protein